MLKLRIRRRDQNLLPQFVQAHDSKSQSAALQGASPSSTMASASPINRCSKRCYGYVNKLTANAFCRYSSATVLHGPAQMPGPHNSPGSSNAQADCRQRNARSNATRTDQHAGGNHRRYS